VLISQVLDQFYDLKISLNAFGDTDLEVPLSVFSNNKAVAKTIAKFENQKTEISITIPKSDFHGNISIEDNSYSGLWLTILISVGPIILFIILITSSGVINGYVYK
jgi:hypothetical protein